MRSAFDTTVDIFSGPRAAVPNVLRGTFPCRLVEQVGILLVGPGTPIRVAWVTLDGIQPVGSWDSPAQGFVPALADQLAIPSGSTKRYWCIYTERVAWRLESPYWRANVALLPILPNGVVTSIYGIPLVIIGSASRGPTEVSGSGGVIFGSA
jgi:hypothetical protein